MTRQLSIDFNPDITKAFDSCVEYVQARIYQMGLQQKSVAADLDLSPSHLSRKLSQNINDSMRFTLDDLENYLSSTGDKEPVKYLVSKYMYQSENDEIANLKTRLAELEGKK